MGTGFFRSPWPILILLVLIVLLFGANKLPGLARNMGESMRIFKNEVSEMRKEDDDDHAEASINVKRDREGARRDDRSYDARDDRDRDYRRDDREYRRDDRDDFRREEPVREARDREDFLGDGRSDDLYRRD
ncbi:MULTISPECIES: twin-arginine translocase TatA/TatE family subunit [Dermabacter]|uniref:Sec-independent protein translocase protein TatA n=1 Tax=Dermabacter jinjuensis TaxID=1667168 RepID=A0ABM6PMY5_9MICO|nr:MULTISPECIES: twin-arginine translocase TatA/TatE family subunit [Dermabacter]ATH96609.1 twin-arginine translocase TatA/TatE family subunit [Dermabacter jinjuensis]UEB90703.1 twin-arginine translocase TatA/TatE family subunit [Dermabacter jinjuensis]